MLFIEETATLYTGEVGTLKRHIVIILNTFSPFPAWSYRLHRGLVSKTPGNDLSSATLDSVGIKYPNPIQFHSPLVRQKGLDAAVKQEQVVHGYSGDD